MNRFWYTLVTNWLYRLVLLSYDSTINEIVPPTKYRPNNPMLFDTGLTLSESEKKTRMNYIFFQFTSKWIVIYFFFCLLTDIDRHDISFCEGINYHPPTRVMSVCVSVCLSVCMSVRAITFEPLITSRLHIKVEVTSRSK